MQSAMLGGRDLEGKALDQRPQSFAREPADLDAPALSLRVEPDQSAMLPAAASKTPSRQRGAPSWTSTLASAAITPPWLRQSSSLCYQDDPRHLHTRHRRHASCYHRRARRDLFLSRLLTRLRKGASAAPSYLYIFPLFAGLLEVAGPGFEPGTP